MMLQRTLVVLLGLALVVNGSGASDTSPAIDATPNAAARFYWEEPGIEHEALIPLDEIISGGPPPDGIPPIDAPRFISVKDATWLDAEEPVLSIAAGDDARAYPIQILIWHEIVNDTIAGTPVAVTYCPLCNSAIVFDRTVAGEVTTFGTSGRLYHSDLVMYDRATKSLWPQIMGKAVVGPRIGEELTVLPSAMASFADFRAAYPKGRVLSRETGHRREYGSNPYIEYDSSERPFLFRGDIDPKLPAISRVVGVRSPAGPKAYSIAALQSIGARTTVNDRIGNLDIVVFFESGTKSALDAPLIAESKDVGSSGVFARSVAGPPLTFIVQGDRFVDDQTGSTWDIFGRAIDGPLKGLQLEPIEKVDTFWFAWAVFVPGAPLWTG